MSWRNALKAKGFTIIEVLIVLAIAGLILLIVFLAVPALQRNSRNMQAKKDAAGLLAAAKEFTNTNQGALPTASDMAEVLSLTKTTSMTLLAIRTSNPGNMNPSVDRAIINTGMKCPATVSGSSVSPDVGPSRGLMIVYEIEGAGGTDLAQCLDA